MSSQLFKKNVPKELIINILEQICFKNDKFYLIDSNAYKKFLFYNLHTQLCEQLKEYYHSGKMFYIERKMTYNSFTNIVRQICKNSNIMFTSQLKYNESKYNIDYFVYF
jgi:hypothetical protein